MEVIRIESELTELDKEFIRRREEERGSWEKYAKEFGLQNVSYGHAMHSARNRKETIVLFKNIVEYLLSKDCVEINLMYIVDVAKALGIPSNFAYRLLRDSNIYGDISPFSPVGVEVVRRSGRGIYLTNVERARTYVSLMNKIIHKIEKS